MRATIGKLSGKWYFEVRGDSVGTAGSYAIGVSPNNAPKANKFLGKETKGCGYRRDGKVYCNQSASAAQTNATWGTNDIVGVAVDMDYRMIYFSKNGVWQNCDPSSLVGGIEIDLDPAHPEQFPDVEVSVNGTLTANFGASALLYPIPTGFASGWFNQMAPSGSTIAQWSTTDKASEISVTSNGTEIESSGSSFGVVRADQSKGAGKWYWEITVVNHTGSNNSYLGSAIATLPLTGIIGVSGVGCGMGPEIYCHQASMPNSTFGFAPGDVIGIAMDVDNDLMYFRKNGMWLNGDPSAGTGGYDMNDGSTLPAYFPAASLKSGWKFKANFGQDRFLYLVPQGYSTGVYQ